MRALEIEVIRELHGTQQQELNVRDLCKVDVDQFHGIEYSEWPVRIAEVALWLMDHQMNALAAEAFGQGFDRLPLKTSPHIVHANALRTDWNTVLPRAQCSYVLGNPPFIGKKEQNAEQKADMEQVWGAVKGASVLDYVTCWYRRAAEYITGAHSGNGTRGANASGSIGRWPVVPGDPPGTSDVVTPPESRTRASATPDASGGSPDATGQRPVLPNAGEARPRVAFVSTNSISQGEQVGILWGDLFQRFHLKIHFAHRTFPWMSEARGKAHVHVIIIGFGASDVTDKRIYDYDAGEDHVTVTTAANINPYLVAASDITIRTRTEPINGAPRISYGSMMIDKDRKPGDDPGLPEAGAN